MPANVTRVVISKRVSRRIGLGHAETARIVSDTIDTICTTLLSGENVRLTGFGAFCLVQRAARVARNPKTGDPAMVPARRSVTLRPSQALLKKVRRGPVRLRRI